jgi:chromosome segregation ATPase
MDQNAFLNNYIENLHKAVGEATTKAIGIQTQLQMLEVAVKEKNDIINEQLAKIGVLTDNVQNLTNQCNIMQAQMEKALEDNPEDAHIDLWKNELTKARAYIAELESKLQPQEVSQETVESN